MNTGFQLYQLQSIDSDLDTAQRRIGEILLAVESNKEVIRAKDNLDQAQADLKKIKSDFTAIDYDIQQKKIKKAQSEANMYSGKIQNPKELQDIQAEIASLTKHLSELDDSLLEKLVILETAENDASLQETKLKQAISKFETEKSMLMAEKGNLENSINNLSIKRTSIVDQINKDLLNTYELLRKQKNGLAVAHLLDNSCSACGASLTASQCQQVRSSSQLFFCPTCGRIVYGS